MKMLKSGFTLAEVLITLGIIGVVAAIVMPSVITSYQYKTIGVKLAKFASQAENSARPFVVQNDSFSSDNKVTAMAFINESFLIKTIEDPDSTVLETVFGKGAKAADYPTYYTLTATKDSEAKTVGFLKDGPSFRARMANTTDDKYDTVATEGKTFHSVDVKKVGEPAFVMKFNPQVTGLPKSVKTEFDFVVTELGYIYPQKNDDCLWKIFDADFATNATTFTDSVCNSAYTTKQTTPNPNP